MNHRANLGGKRPTNHGRIAQGRQGAAERVGELIEGDRMGDDAAVLLLER